MEHIKLREMNREAKLVDNKWMFFDESKCELYTWDPSAAIGTVKPGNKIFIGWQKWLVVGHGADTTALVFDGDSKTYRIRPENVEFARTHPAQYLLAMCNEIHGINIAIPVSARVEHTVKTVAVNGDRPERNSKQTISLLTLDLYRRYREYLTEPWGCWWLATPAQYNVDPDNDGELCMVRPDGLVGWAPYANYDGGQIYNIRPFVIVDSAYTGYSLPELPE